MSLWKIEPDWENEKVFVIGGGPSVLHQDISMLKGQRVIVINSSYEVAPFADMLFFADKDWYRLHKPKLASFKGDIVTTSQQAPGENLKRLRKLIPVECHEGLSKDRSSVVAQRTGLQAVLNICVHKGVRTIVLVGFDMQRDTDGRTHHHAPHENENKPGNRTWDIQMKQLKLMVAPLQNLGIEILNVSPVSRIPWWRKVTFEEAYWGSYTPEYRFGGE